MDKDELLRLLETDPDVRRAVIRAVAVEIGGNNPQLVDAILKDLNGRVRRGAHHFLDADAVSPKRR